MYANKNVLWLQQAFWTAHTNSSQSICRNPGVNTSRTFTFWSLRLGLFWYSMHQYNYQKPKAPVQITTNKTKHEATEDRTRVLASRQNQNIHWQNDGRWCHIRFVPGQTVKHRPNEKRAVLVRISGRNEYSPSSYWNNKHKSKDIYRDWITSFTEKNDTI